MAHGRPRDLRKQQQCQRWIQRWQDREKQDIQGMRAEIALAIVPGTWDNAPILGSQDMLRQSQVHHDYPFQED